MILRGVYCAGGKAAVLRAGARLPSRFAAGAQGRFLSAGGLQRASPLAARASLFGAPGSTRNFWWSSKGSSEPSAPVSSDSAAIFENNATAVVDQPPAEVATLVESANALDAAPVTGTLQGSDAASDTVLESVSSSLTDTVAQITPLQFGDLAALGLGGWSPIGLSQHLLEAIHVSLGVPWFWTIVAGTVASRVLIFPFALKGLRNAARMAPHQPEFERLREEIQRAARTGEQGAMQRAVLKQQALYKKIGVSVPGMLVPPFAQIPVTLGMFFGVKRMCDLPVPQLRDSGVALFPDLTVPDPTYALPIVATAGMNWVLTLGMRDMSASAHLPHIINFFRALSLLGFFFMVNLPTGTLVYLTTGIVCMGVQSAVLRVPAVRVALGLPLRSAGDGLKPASMIDSVRYAKTYWEEQKTKAIEKARADAARARRR